MFDKVVKDELSRPEISLQIINHLCFHNQVLNVGPKSYVRWVSEVDVEFNSRWELYYESVGDAILWSSVSWAQPCFFRV